MDEILRLRDQIDRTDNEIVRLLKDRDDKARLLGQIKNARRIRPRDQKREIAILDRVGRTSEQLGLEPASIQQIFKQIFALAVHAQRDISRRRELQGLRILVLGGTGGMGRLFAQLMRLQGGSVSIVGRKPNRTRRAGREMEIEAGSISDARSSDIVIVATPLNTTRNDVLRVAEQMRDGALLTDLSSVKTGVIDRIATKMPRQVEYVSLHPLFSPEVDHPHGQTILAIPLRTGPIWRRLARALRTEGANVENCSIQTHDRTMAYVQAMHHYALLTLGVGLRRWNGSFTTNSLSITESRIRSLLRNWATVAGIQQKNPYAQSARDEFIAAARRLRTMTSSDLRYSKTMLLSNVQKWSRKI